MRAEKITLCIRLLFLSTALVFLTIQPVYAQQGPADIEGATILCNKSKYTVGLMEGCGQNCNEAVGTCLGDGVGSDVETNAIWFTFQAANDGDLTFVIEALDPNDRLSFALVQLPNGFNDGTNMVTRRCVAACSFNTIGLNSTAFDVVEEANCPPENDGFLEALHMERGLVYGLMVNNPNSTGGFTIEFGGDGELEGPTAQISPNDAQVCFGQTVTFENNSFIGQSAGSIVGYQWDFGPDVVGDRIRASATNEPQVVEYTTTGPKTVELVIRTSLNCEATTVFENIVTIESCCETDNKVTIADDPIIEEIACPGDTNGSINIEVSSLFPVTYDWSNGAITEDIENLPPGNYSVTVTSEATCKDTFSYAFIIPSTLSATETVVPPSCGGRADGSITITATGGRAPYLYDFGDGNLVTTETLNNLDTGDYSVIVQDASGCTFPIEAIELDDKELLIEIASLSDPGCNRGTDGRVEINIMNNGVAPYQFDLNDGNGPVDATALSQLGAGDYIVDVIDAEQCQGLFEFSLSEPEEMRLILEAGGISCHNANDGALIAIASGGTPGYTYSWNNGASGSTINNLSPGEYTVVVTDSKGCTIQANQPLTQPEELQASITNVLDVQCPGQSDGSIDLQISGGIAPYQFSTDGINFEQGTTISNLDARDYQITIKDNNDCTVSLQTSIDSPANLSINTNITSNLCYGQSLIITDASTFTRGVVTQWEWDFGEGANPASITDTQADLYEVTYTKIGNPIVTLTLQTDLGCEVELKDTLDLAVEPCCNAGNGINLLSIVEAPLCAGDANGFIDMTISSTPPVTRIDWDSGQNSANIENLPAGEYTVLVENDATCTATSTITIEDPEPLSGILTLTTPSCEAAANGSIEVIASGGTGNNYEYNFGTGFTDINILENLLVGNYRVVVQDENDCQLPIDTSLFIPEGTEPFMADLIINTPSCEEANNGSIEVTISGTGTGTGMGTGINGYQFDFGNGLSSNNIAENLTVGTYNITIQDKDNCTLTFNPTLSVEENTNPVSLSLSIINPSCGGASDGSIIVSPSGESGTNPDNYEYNFGSGFQQANFDANLANGNYSVTIRNENNCSASADTSLNELILSPDPPNVTTPTCFGLADGQIEFTVPNGTGPFLYDLNDGNGFQNESALSGLPDGVYTVRIQDGDLCLSPPVEVAVTQPEALTITALPVNVSCFGAGDGSISVEVSGGVGTYSYIWNDGQTSRVATNLSPGTYTVSVTDDNNCPIESGGENITEPEALNASVSAVSNVLCFGETNGTITVEANGGNLPFSYSIDGILFQNASRIEGLPAGDYTITVRDDRGCEAETGTATVNEPGEFYITADADRTIANLGFPVRLSATSNIGNTGVNFTWSTPDSVICNNCPTFETVPPGSTIFTVVAVNDDNCRATASLEIAVSLDRPVYIPNTFSPNGDGVNDEFFIPFSPSMNSIAELQIFDRWGNLVFEEFNIQRGEEMTRSWDGFFNGSEVRYGVFVVAVKIHFVDGQILPYHADLTIFGKD